MMEHTNLFNNVLLTDMVTIFKMFRIVSVNRVYTQRHDNYTSIDYPHAIQYKL